MRLILDKPSPDSGGIVMLSRLAGSIKVWTTTNKGTEVMLPATFPTNSLPLTLWVEATAVSTTVRDIALEMDYKGVKDVVNATGIWATKTGFKNKAADQLWADAGDPLRTHFTKPDSAYGGKFGLQIRPAPIGVVNAMGMEFTVAPSGVGSESGIRFDITRQVEANSLLSGQKSRNDNCLPI